MRKMATHDRYEQDILRALKGIDSSLKKIADALVPKNEKKTIDKVKEMDGKLLQLEENMSKRLIKLYQADKDNVKSFSEFVRKYNDYFYTLNILKEVYKNSGMKGSYKGWLDNFRLKNKLEFYTSKDIKELQKAMKKSVKTYMK